MLHVEAEDSPVEQMSYLCMQAHSPLGSKDVPRVEGVPKPPVLLENEVVKKVGQEVV